MHQGMPRASSLQQKVDPTNKALLDVNARTSHLLLYSEQLLIPWFQSIQKEVSNSLSINQHTHGIRNCMLSKVSYLQLIQATLLGDLPTGGKSLSKCCGKKGR